MNTFSLKIATLADDTTELETLVEADGLTGGQLVREIQHRVSTTPKPADGEAPLAFDITIVRND